MNLSKGLTMKIFDFSNGVKGKQLGEITCGALGGWWLNGLRLDGKSVQIDRYQYHEKVWTKYGNKQIKPEDFGVQAICFCQVFTANNGEKVYKWSYICTKEWLDANVNWQYDVKANEENRKFAESEGRTYPSYPEN
jgi:hypothetical protein